MVSKSKKGMTLIEILIATLIFTLALGSVLGSLTLVADLIDIARDKTVATSDLRNMMERIRAVPFDSMLAKFPNGLTDGPASNPYQNITGSYVLRNENITVTYANPNTDPLEINVLARWKDKKGHLFNMSVPTFKTRQ